MRASATTVTLSHKTYFSDFHQQIELNKLKEIAAIYANIFADPPWNEYKGCSKGHYEGRDYLEEHCSQCHEPLSLAYPEDETIKMIVEETSSPGGFLTSFENQEGKIVAAGWGFACDAEGFAHIYKTDAMQKAGAERVRKEVPEGNLFYVSEIMVDLASRGQGIGSRIAEELVEHAGALKLRAVLHTHDDSPMAKIANKIGMFRIINVGEDSENPSRIAYLLKV